MKLTCCQKCVFLKLQHYDGELKMQLEYSVRSCFSCFCDTATHTGAKGTEVYNIACTDQKKD